MLIEPSSLERCKDEIKFNGSPISDVISYNEDTGQIHYYERDWRTQDLIPDGTDPTGYRTCSAKGKVEVVHKYTPPPVDYGQQASSCDGVDQGWYPYGCPSFSQDVSSLSFVYGGFEEIDCFDDLGNLQGVHKVSVTSDLVVDGDALGNTWTMITADVNDVVNARFAFVKLRQASLSPSQQRRSTVSRSYLKSVGLQGRAYAAVGYPHIYKIVKVYKAVMSSTWPPILQVGNINQWKVGTKINLESDGPRFVGFNYIESLSQLCLSQKLP